MKMKLSYDESLNPFCSEDDDVDDNRNVDGGGRENNTEIEETVKEEEKIKEEASPSVTQSPSDSSCNLQSNGAPPVSRSKPSSNTSKEVEWLPVYLRNCQHMHRKTREKSVLFRNEGNKYFQKKQYERAVECYTTSILHAPVSVPNQVPVLAWALGNRSAALFHLRHYKECLQDINLSLASGYPEENSHKLLTRKAYCLLHLGHLEEAHQVLQKLKSNCEEITGLLDKHKRDSVEKDISNLEQKILEQDSPAVTKIKVKDGKGCLPKVSYGASDLITQASSAIIMKYSMTKGRYLIAQKSVKAGDTLIVERPYAAVLLPDHYHSHCHHCFHTLSLAPLPCEECCMVLYCSRECRDRAWSVYHSVECCYQNLFFSVGIAHLSLRIILTAGYSYLLDFLSDIPNLEVVSDMVHMPYGQDYGTVYQLVTHELDMMVDDLFQYTLTANLLLLVLRHSAWIPAPMHPSSPLSDNALCIGSLLLQHILQLVCNAHAITELQISQIGDHHMVDTKSQVRVATAIYPTASLMNHSCDPSILSSCPHCAYLISFQGDVLVVRTVKDVAAEEEILNCYGPHCKRMVREERQQSLYSQYFFHCTCTACQEEDKSTLHHKGTLLCSNCGHDIIRPYRKCPSCSHNLDIDKMTSDITQAEKDFQHGIQKLQEMNIPEATASFNQCVEVRRRTLYRHHRSLCEARDCLARCYAMTGQFASAAQYLEENLPSTELTYGDTSIEVGHELHKLAEVLFNDQQIEKALDIINRALDIFKVHCGEDSNDKNIEELKQMRECLIN